MSPFATGKYDLLEAIHIICHWNRDGTIKWIDALQVKQATKHIHAMQKSSSQLDDYLNLPYHTQKTVSLEGYPNHCVSTLNPFSANPFHNLWNVTWVCHLLFAFTSMWYHSLFSMAQHVGGCPYFNDFPLSTMQIIVSALFNSRIPQKTRSKP